MPFCAKCGSSVGEGAAFCPSCGATVGSSSAPAAASAPVAATPVAAGGTGMEENVAGLLCYVLGWVTGIIFFIIDKRPFVRFHAAQSMVVFGGIAIIYIVLGMFVSASLFAGGFAGAGLFSLLYPVVWLLTIVLWVLLMVKAYGHQKFRIPVAADLAEKIFGVS
jgi:uncharacterized membrane protein